MPKGIMYYIVLLIVTVCFRAFNCRSVKHKLLSRHMARSELLL